MKKNSLLITSIFIFLMAVACFTGCDDYIELDDNGINFDIEIAGTWIDPYNVKLVINDSKIDFYSQSTDTETSYEAIIHGYNNSIWNGDESGTGDDGFMVIKYSKAPSWNPDCQGKYMIFRWQNLDAGAAPITMDYAEGSNYPTNTYFDSEAEAVTGATTAEGFFVFFTVGAVLQ
jgi:hypothetical protein